jgi:hypothetical protein
MDCEVCKGHGDVLGAACAVCAGGTGRAYDGVYMSWGGGCNLRPSRTSALSAIRI